MAQMSATFDIHPSEVLKVSAKTGKRLLSNSVWVSDKTVLIGVGVESVLQAIIDRIPPPPAARDQQLKALLFDSLYVAYRRPHKFFGY